MKFDQLVAQRLDDAPAAGGGTRGHDDGAGQFDPERYLEILRIGVQTQEVQPLRQVVELSGDTGGHQRERDDAHGLLGVVRAVRPAHRTGRDDLQLAEQRVGKARPANSLQHALAVGEEGEQREQQAHDDEAEKEPGQRRDDHRQHDLGQQTLALPPVFTTGYVPDDRVEVAARRGERGAAEAADQRMRGRRWQAPPPGDQVPDHGRRTRRRSAPWR